MQQVLYITYDGIMEPIGNSQILSYLKGLSGEGIKFYLISFEKTKYLNDKIQKNVFRTELKKYNIEWYMLRYHKRFRTLATIFDITIGVFKAMSIARKRKLDIVHARSYIAGLMAWTVSLSTNIKFVFDMRGFWADERVDAGLLKKHSILYKVIKSFEKLFIRKAEKVIVLTNKAKEVLVWRFPDIKESKISIIPCCANAALFKFDKKARNLIRSKYNIENRLVFIHTGSLIGWYLLREMLEYFRTIKKLEPKALFMFLTTKANKNELFKTVEKLEIPRSDILLTETSFESMPGYLSSADVGLFFIKPTFSKKASCPIKFAEYLSCGLPVICNRNIGDLDTIIESNKVGVLVESFNENSYNNSHRRFLTLSSDKNLKNRCHNVAEGLFSIEKGIASYLDVYKGCLT